MVYLVVWRQLHGRHAVDVFLDLVEEVIPASNQTTLVLIVHQVKLIWVPNFTDLRNSKHRNYNKALQNFQKINSRRLALFTCLRNSSKAISPWATRRTSFTTISFFCRSTSQICPRVSSDRTQFTCKRFISCFQWRSLRASDFSSITNMLTWRKKRIARGFNKQLF